MSNQLSFEDVEIGDRLPDLVKGPLTSAHLMRWSAAMENWHKIHYDSEFATQHDKLPGVLINGSLKQQFIVQLLRDWAGRDGWVSKVKFQFRSMNIVGETLTIWGKVTGKSRAADFGFVRVELGIENDAGVESSPGEAVIALPFRGGRPVPYPFAAPAGAIAFD